MGPEVAVARPAAAPGGQLCARPQRINEAACLGFCPPAGVIVPRVMDFALQVEPLPYDPAKAKKLLAEAGYPNGFDAGEFAAIPGFPTVAEAVVNDLNAAGIRVRLRQMERATFYATWQEKKLRGLFMAAAGNSGNAASRVDTFIDCLRANHRILEQAQGLAGRLWQYHLHAPAAQRLPGRRSRDVRGQFAARRRVQSRSLVTPAKCSNLSFLTAWQ